MGKPNLEMPSFHQRWRNHLSAAKSSHIRAHCRHQKIHQRSTIQISRPTGARPGGQTRSEAGGLLGYEN